jgi:hypothetical protein
LPLAVAGVALVLLGIVGSVIGNGNGDDAIGGLGPADTTTTTVAETTTTTVRPIAAAPPRTTTTTTTTLPPTLADTFPFANRGLTAVARSGQSGSVLIWQPGSREPRVFATTGRPDVAAFNATGDTLAYLAFSGLGGGTLHIGPPGGVQPAQSVRASSFAWHPRDPGSIAWIAEDPVTRETRLLVGSLDPVAGLLTVDEVVAVMSPRDLLLAWGDWGFLVSRSDPDTPFFTWLSGDGETGGVVGFPLTATLHLDPGGAVLHSAPAIPLDATGDGDVLLISTAQAYEEATQSLSPAELGFGGEIVDALPSGLYVADVSLVPRVSQPTLSPDGWHYLAPDGARVAEITARDNVTSVTTQDVGGRSTRIVGVDGPHRPLGFTVDGTWIALQNEATGDLRFVDWRSGAIRTIEFQRNGFGVAVDLR